MGHGVADNFLKNGYEVFVWNRHQEKAKDLVSKGAKLADSPKEAAQKADIIFEVTADDESSRKVWLNDGILAAANSSRTLITCATLSVKWVEELAKICQDKKLTFFDMPMTGTRMGAESGQLTLFAGGDKAKLSLVKNDLMAIAKKIKYFGPAGSGTKYKLIMNMLQAIHLAGFGEALRLAEKAGLDIRQVGDSLAEAPGGTTTNLAWKMYRKDPDPINFSVQWIHKDLKYARELAKDLDHPLLDDVISRFQEAVNKGFAEADWTKINKL